MGVVWVVTICGCGVGGDYVGVVWVVTICGCGVGGGYMWVWCGR